MKPLYRLEAVRIEHAGKPVLSVPRLEIHEARVYTLVGPNGSGKSTLLSVLAFLRAPASGTVAYDGAPVHWRAADLVRLRREAVLLHQAPYLFHGTVADNVGFGLRVRGVRGAELSRRVSAALAAVGLSGFGERKARQLSGGEAQRVAVARVLALAPRVLLLDEPLANVDLGTAAVIDRAIAACAANGTTVVVATHDAAHPGRVATDVIRLADGEICGVEDPRRSGFHSVTGVPMR